MAECAISLTHADCVPERCNLASNCQYRNGAQPEEEPDPVEQIENERMDMELSREYDDPRSIGGQPLI